MMEPRLSLVSSLLLLLSLAVTIPAQNNDADDPPRITMAPQNQRVVENGIVSFFCKAGGNPAPDVYWRKNERRISINRNRYLTIDMPHGSVLRIEPVRPRRDDASFECVADNGIEEPAIASATLEVYPEGQVPSGYPRILENPTLKAVEKDRNMVMLCDATGSPETEIMWLKDFIPVDLTDPRLKLLSTGSLQIRNSQESDEGKYECVSSNMAGVAYSYAANLYVRVRRVPPHFSILPENVEVMPGGGANITCVAVGSPMPYVKWRQGAIELTPEDNVPVGKNILMLTDITESANYTCVAASDLGNIEAVAQVKVKALPKPPTSVVTSEVTATSVKLTWNPGNVDPVYSYIIQYRKKYASGAAYDEISDIEDTEFTVTNLNAFTTYEFRLVAVNNIGRGTPSSEVDVTTGELVPGSPPRNTRARPVSSSTVLVQWDEPAIPNGVIKGYYVYYTLNPDLPLNLWTLHKVTDNSHLTTIGNLLTNRTYTLTVQAFTGPGKGPLSERKQVKTRQGVPEQPTNLQGEAISPNSITLSWDPPEDSGHSIESYDLYYNDSHFHQRLQVTIKPPRNTYLLSDLTPDTVYHIQVSATSLRGEGARTTIIQVRTLEYVPGEPKKVRAEAINSTAAKVEWQPPDEQERNGVIRGYQIYYMKVERDEGLSGMQVYELLEATEAVIGGLEPDTTYNFQVAAYTRKGDGLRSRLKQVKTKGAVPSAPRNVHLELEQENPPIVSVTWQQPRSTFGELRGYRVVYGTEGQSSTERRLDADKYRARTGFLEKGLIYEFRISAMNSVDYGEEAVATIRTPDGIPRGSPLNFTATGVSSTSIRLEWEEPSRELRNGEITLYEIMFHKMDDTIDVQDVNTSDTDMTIDGLEMNTDYVFQIKAYTRRGPGPWSNHLPFRTFGKLPPAPTHVDVRRISPTAVQVSWIPPSDFKGIASYRVYYSVRVMQNMEDWESVETGEPTSQTTIGGLDTHSMYAFRVAAKSVDGRYGNLSELVTTLSDPDLPDMVQDFQVRSQDPKSVWLEWKIPRKPGVTRYKISYEGRKNYRDQDNIMQTLIDPQRTKLLSLEEKNFITDGLIPKTVYTFNISAKFLDGSWGPVYTLKVETSADAPPPMAAPEFVEAVGQSQIKLRLHRASEKYGPVTFYHLIVLPEQLAAQMDADEVKTEELSQPDADPNEVGWIAARFEGDINPNHMFLLGDGVGTIDGYINRPLKKGRKYRVFLRAHTGKKSTSTEYSKSLTAGMVLGVTESPLTERTDSKGMLWIVAPICGAVVLVLLIVLIIIFMRRRPARKAPKIQLEPTKPPYTEPPAHPTDPVEMRRLNFQTPAMMSHPPIPVADLADHIERLKAQDGLKFSQEYESIEPGQQFTWDNSNLEVNKSKNRYANVIAYDHSRVILQPIDGVTGSDYINANYMDGYRKQNAYIATQGPLPETFCDFWRMVWEQRTATIVMMTKLEERTRIKCDQYWPNRGTETYSQLQVTLIDVMELATYTIRTFQLMRTGCPEKREVRQFQFTAWPDHGVPDHPTPLLLFMRRVKAMTPPDTGPMVTHCSAGVGRTGAFIVIDAMLERIKHEKTVDIYGHVTCLRAQRNYMVQTEDQYIFIHDALLEAVASGNTEIPARNLYAHIQKLTQPEPGDTVTSMELEFKKLASTKASPAKFVSANLPVNKFKNRLVNILPYESTRVCLQPIRGVDGSDYINASYIDGYRYRKAYIGTQGPLAETTEDFWRMLWEHNSTIIVMLTKLREMGREKCHQYWPSERSARYQYFVVDPMTEYNMPQYILREFKVTDARDGQSRTIRQFQFTDWPEQGVPKSGEGFIDFIGQVHKTKEQFGQDGPISVHCSAGVGRTGVFITLSIVLERMRYEGVVDMYQTVKMLRTQRPAMVQTEDQYGFCYRAALEYLGSFDHYAN